MQGARRRPWWLPRASRATPQTPLSLPTLRDRADFPSCGVVASLLGIYPTASAPPHLSGKSAAVAATEIFRQAPSHRAALRLGCCLEQYTWQHPPINACWNYLKNGSRVLSCTPSMLHWTMTAILKFNPGRNISVQADGSSILPSRKR